MNAGVFLPLICTGRNSVSNKKHEKRKKITHTKNPLLSISPPPPRLVSISIHAPPFLTPSNISFCIADPSFLSCFFLGGGERRAPGQRCALKPRDLRRVRLTLSRPSVFVRLLFRTLPPFSLDSGALLCGNTLFSLESFR